MGPRQQCCPADTICSQAVHMHMQVAVPAWLEQRVAAMQQTCVQPGLLSPPAHLQAGLSGTQGHWGSNNTP